MIFDIHLIRRRKYSLKPYGKISLEKELSRTVLSVTYHFDHRRGKYEFMSSGISELIGYSCAELNKLGFENLVKEVSEITSDEITTQETEPDGREARHYYANYLVTTKDGGEKWLQDKATRFVDSQGNNLFSVGTLKEYTESDNLIEKFKYSNENIETVFDLANLLLLVIDEDQKIRLVNKKACELLGISQSDIIGKEWTNLVSADAAVELSDNIEKTFKEIIPPPQNREITLISRSGEPKAIQYNNTVLRDETGKIVRLMSLGLDVTNKKKEEKIQEVIFRIIQHSNEETDLEELFHFIHSGIRELMLAENFYIALYDEKNSLITFPYFIDKYDKEAPADEIRKGTNRIYITNRQSRIDYKGKR